jgi:hypothetical protein
MGGIGLLIAICFLITFGPPVLFLIMGLNMRNKDKNNGKGLIILSVVWLIIGGGICASIMT